MSKERHDQPAGFQIRFDGPPSHETPRFIEAEDLCGRSIRLGEWVQDGEEWLLRVAASDPWRYDLGAAPAGKWLAGLVSDGEMMHWEPIRKSPDTGGWEDLSLDVDVIAWMDLDGSWTPRADPGKT